MKIICLVKFTPDVDAFEYDYENNVLIRDNVKQIINPDDACALGFAIRLKKKYPEIQIEVVTMGPLSVKKNMEDEMEFIKGITVHVEPCINCPGNTCKK